MRAILSVSDKTGLAEFAQGLSQLGVELFSTGGTKSALEAAQVPVRSVSDITGFPEILDGRVKTLHPAVHGGILARRDLPAHMEEIARQGIEPIDLLVVNLYPFVETVSREGVTLEEALENIDIGGPTMVRAAAKNFPAVTVVVDPGDYGDVLGHLKAGEVPLEARRRLAQKAFQHVASYDTAIAAYLRPEDKVLPQHLTVALEKRQALRYGENPHQRAAFYVTRTPGRRLPPGLANAEQLHGLELSYNNILDADAAWGAVTDFERPTVAIIKHTNPCGLACHEDLVEAYKRALAGDPVSAYGGIVACNRPVTEAMADAMRGVLFDIVIAPDYEPGALTILRRRRNTRVLKTGGLPTTEELSYVDFRRVRGGFLVQTADDSRLGEVELRTVTERAPTDEEVHDLLFGWQAIKHVKSNAILLVKDDAILGMGAGQPNRVNSARLAVAAAGDRARGSVAVSDAMIPFPDTVEVVADAGATALIQPGGSTQTGAGDEAAIQLCNQRGMAMVFTGMRHFRH